MRFGPVKGRNVTTAITGSFPLGVKHLAPRGLFLTYHLIIKILNSAFDECAFNINENWNGGMSMRFLVLKLRRFLISEDGPTAVEYAVMLALIIIVCLTAISSIGTRASTTFNRVSSSLNT
jgi:pilus assembly protein Flp/PilA